MMEPKYRSVFVPPLNLTPKVEPSALLGRLLGHKNDEKKSNPVEALKQNSEFLKEKSLYRYYISKNRTSGSREKGDLIPVSPERIVKADSKHKLARILSTKDIPNVQCQLVKSPTQVESNKQKYFKRKNRINRTQFCLKQRTQQNTMDNQEEGSEKSIIELLNNDSDSRMLKSSSSINFQDLVQKEAEISHLKQQNEAITKENIKLKQKLLQKQQKIQQLNLHIQALQEQKRKMQTEIDKYANRVTFKQAEQQQLLNQLSLKEAAIKQLENGYKYIEIENTVLNHAKSQCSLQKAVIEHLQRDKKMLQEKVRLLYESSKKKKNQSCLMKDDQQISLNLSIEKEQKQRLDDLLLIIDDQPKSSKFSRNLSTHRVYTCAHKQ